ncbi:hypothetical protein B0A55_04308 [Friedmanniomyces simplex]|uniref:Uncharacterized protein n=1 Tax=Friedmanniomyces simplex TaxID=329884 RepID=A0A4U0X8A4_9PEZI|nr:hypothetical protein B0A55_04308 [Friedmanniomyces simplex]
MGAVVSCFESVVAAITSCFMAIVNGIVTVVKAIINGIVAVVMALVSCLTCGKTRKRHDECGLSEVGYLGTTRRDVHAYAYAYAYAKHHSTPPTYER